MLARRLLEQDIRQLATQGRSVLLVERRAQAALRVSDWSYIMTGGSIGTSAAALDLVARGSVGAILIGGT